MMDFPTERPRVVLRWVVLAVALFLACLSELPAQVLMQPSRPGGLLRIFPSDLAVLEAGESRNDLPCEVTPVKPFLGFDLRFHAGYDVTVPMSELAGSEDMLTTVFRVTPAGGGDPVYLSQRVRVPAFEGEAKGNAFLQGSFDLGEGKYNIDWVMRDRSERVCASFWDAEAELPDRDKTLQMALKAGEVAAPEPEQFREEAPVRRNERNGLNVKVLVNFAPQNARAASLQPLDTAALVSILRNIAREPQISAFSVVAFNMQEQRVVYRQDGGEQIDFPALGDALDSLALGTVDLKRLAQKHGETEFLKDLVTREMNCEKPPDALIFAGPKVMLEQNVSRETLSSEVGELTYPVFYMNYNFNPLTNPWRDAIGNVVKFFKGYEYTISRPRDLWFAWSEIVSHIVKSKQARETSDTPAK